MWAAGLGRRAGGEGRPSLAVFLRGGNTKRNKNKNTNRAGASGLRRLINRHARAALSNPSALEISLGLASPKQALVGDLDC